MSSILGKEAVTMEDMIRELAPSEKDQRALMANVTMNASKKGRKAGKKEAEKFKLDKPVTGPAGERVARAAIYSRVKEDVSQWDAVVHSRRAAETVSYPQRNDAMRLPTAKEAASAFKVKFRVMSTMIFVQYVFNFTASNSFGKRSCGPPAKIPSCRCSTREGVERERGERPRQS